MFITFSPKKDRNDLQHYWLCCMQAFQPLDSPKVVRTHIKISNSPLRTGVRHTVLEYDIRCCRKTYSSWVG